MYFTGENENSYELFYKQLNTKYLKLKKNRIIAIEAEKYHLLSKIKKDLIINIASFSGNGS